MLKKLPKIYANILRDLAHISAGFLSLFWHGYLPQPRISPFKLMSGKAWHVSTLIKAGVEGVFDKSLFKTLKGSHFPSGNQRG